MMHEAMNTLSPRELAASAGVSTDTLRHYEKSGVLPKPARTRAGYRRYPAVAVTRVALVRRALAIGFSIKELTRVFRERDQGGAPAVKSAPSSAIASRASTWSWRRWSRRNPT